MDLKYGAIPILRIREAFTALERVLLAVPEPLRSSLIGELKKLRELLLDHRPPRLAILGRRGSGKSTLVNALFSEPLAEVGPVKSTTSEGRWYAYSEQRGRIDILDTRGLGEGARPEGDATRSAIELVHEAINQTCPDALLFLCKAKEVDARIDMDLAELRAIKRYIHQRHGHDPPIIALVTQVDELDPPEVTQPPFADEEKQANIAAATQHLAQMIAQVVGPATEVIPICAYLRFREQTIVHDRRWNIGRLVDYLIDHLPRTAQLQMSRVANIKSVQKKMARLLISSTATIAGGVGATPIPMADLPLITSAQLGMITGIAYISGRELDKRTAREFLGALGVNVGAAFAFREVARAAIKLIAPLGGNLISGAVAAAGTWALGHAASAYFIDGLGLEQARAIFKRERRSLPETQHDKTAETQTKE